MRRSDRPAKRSGSVNGHLSQPSERSHPQHDPEGGLEAEGRLTLVCFRAGGHVPEPYWPSARLEESTCDLTTNSTPWRPADELEENPVGLPRSTAEAIVTELDKHLATLFVLFHQCQKHH